VYLHHVFLHPGLISRLWTRSIRQPWYFGNLYLENYEKIAYLNYNVIKENRIQIPEDQLGVKFEEFIKTIFSKLGFNPIFLKNLNYFQASILGKCQYFVSLIRTITC
jgi:hypothetical protein